MKKIIAGFSAFMLILVSLFTLSSCTKKTFYSEWHKAGATIEKKNVFKSVTVSEVEELLKNESKNTFALFVGNSSEAAAVSDVTAIQYAADAKNYEGKVYFLTTTDFTSLSKKKEIKQNLSIDISEMGNNVICVMYESGKIKYNTSITKIDDSNYTQFKLKESDKVFDITLIFEYAVAKYPLKAE